MLSGESSDLAFPSQYFSFEQLESGHFELHKHVQRRLGSYNINTM